MVVYDAITRNLHIIAINVTARKGAKAQSVLIVSHTIKVLTLYGFMTLRYKTSLFSLSKRSIRSFGREVGACHADGGTTEASHIQ